MAHSNMLKPEIIDLPSYVDDRGVFTPVWNSIIVPGTGQMVKLISGCAGAELPDVKRVYFINNSQKGVVRGFHYHLQETKYFIILRGMAKFVTSGPHGVQAITDFQNYRETKDLLDRCQEFVLSEKKPQLLVIPPRYANGWASLTDDCLLLSLSSSTFNESKNDDLRINPTLYPHWGVKAR